MTLVLLGAGLCALVTATDPHRVFFGSPIPQIFPNARRTKIDLFRAYSKQKVSGLILGTSTSAGLRPELADRLTGLRFFNASVNSGTTDDYLAFYRLFSHLQSVPPRAVVIGVDTVFLSSNIELSRDLSKQYDLSRELGTSTSLPMHYARLYWSYFNFKTFTDFRTSLSNWRSPEEPFYQYYPNGKLRPVKSDREILNGTYDRRGHILDAMNSRLPLYRDFGSVSTARVGRLESLLQDASRDRAQVVLWFTPMHPELRAAVDQLQASPVIDQARKAVTALGIRYGARVVDLSRPESFGGGPSTWYDAVHVSPADADRELEHVISQITRSN